MKVLVSSLPAYVAGRLSQGGRYGVMVRAANARRKARSPAQKLVSNAFRVSVWFASSLTRAGQSYHTYDVSSLWNGPANCVRLYLAGWYYSRTYPVDPAGSAALVWSGFFAIETITSLMPSVDPSGANPNLLGFWYRVSNGRASPTDPVSQYSGTFAAGWAGVKYVDHSTLWAERGYAPFEAGKWYRFELGLSNAFDNGAVTYQDVQAV